ncbi:MAG TPA: polyprenyl synthetase family protein [Acidimicrobiia bacterium]|nr:polyprenyl synthetase family protein [Acidimicrobiia bacterium]
MQPSPALPPGLVEVGARTERRVVTLLDAEIVQWRAVDAALAEPIEALRAMVTAGGKGVRAAFCYWAFIGAGGDEGDGRIVDLCAAVEMLHACALVHDDVIDGSATRRGRPSVHRHFVDRHDASSAPGESRRFGEGAAILVGDLAFVYADMLLGAAPVAAREVFDRMRVELCVGQFLDLFGSASAERDRVRADRIQHYKTGKYTVERPLHLGAALAGRLDGLEAPLSGYGVPLGTAFQLRDDLLGVFGDPLVTGKPVGDDLREGKLTTLLAVATDAADSAQRDVLAMVGRGPLGDDDVRSIQQVMVDTGAVEQVEHTITELVHESATALHEAPVTPAARDALGALARFVAWRDR